MPEPIPARGLLDVLKWRVTSSPRPWPRHVPLERQPRPPRPVGPDLVVTWLGHASFLVQTTAGSILFDPVFAERASPVQWAGPRRAHAVPLALDDLPELAAVCISHDHYDHLDLGTLRRLAKRPGLTFIAPKRHRDLLRRAGAVTIVELDWWETHRFTSGLALTLTPTKHWSNRLGTPRNHRLWGGFYVHVPPAAGGGSTGEPARLWFVGDSGYDEEVIRSVRATQGEPDIALVPIGAYEPRWFMEPLHMNPAEAVALHMGSGARRSVAMHWGTFQLTDEAREAPVEALREALAKAEVPATDFRVLAPGESLVETPHRRQATVDGRSR